VVGALVEMGPGQAPGASRPEVVAPGLAALTVERDAPGLPRQDEDRPNELPAVGAECPTELPVPCHVCLCCLPLNPAQNMVSCTRRSDSAASGPYSFGCRALTVRSRRPAPASGSMRSPNSAHSPQAPQCASDVSSSRLPSSGRSNPSPASSLMKQCVTAGVLQKSQMGGSQVGRS